MLRCLILACISTWTWCCAAWSSLAVPHELDAPLFDLHWQFYMNFFLRCLINIVAVRPPDRQTVAVRPSPSDRRVRPSPQAVASDRRVRPSRHVTSRHVTSRRVASRRVASRHVMSGHVTSGHVTSPSERRRHRRTVTAGPSRDVASRHLTSRQATQWRTMLPKASFDVMDLSELLGAEGLVCASMLLKELGPVIESRRQIRATRCGRWGMWLGRVKFLGQVRVFVSNLWSRRIKKILGMAWYGLEPGWNLWWLCPGLGVTVVLYDSHCFDLLIKLEQKVVVAGLSCAKGAYYAYANLACLMDFADEEPEDWLASEAFSEWPGGANLPDISLWRPLVPCSKRKGGVAGHHKGSKMARKSFWISLLEDCVSRQSCLVKLTETT